MKGTDTTRTSEITPDIVTTEGYAGDYKQVFNLKAGVTKIRVYMWIEGQDVDSLETVSSGLNLAVVINFFKDIAGYEYYND